MTKALRVTIAFCIGLCIAACTSVPFDYPKTASEAIPPLQTTVLGQELSEWRQEHEGKSGFVALEFGIDALGARLALMEAARSSIDAQYFLLKPDQAGELFLGKLLRAADRGVRVRLLLDDIFTPRMDSILAQLTTHPNIEVRLFNPLSRQSPKAWNFILDFRRINRRMHNKTFIVDGSIAIMGGRNIAEEYFELKPQQDFDDLELMIIGDIVPEVSHSFDAFWNSQLCVPMEAFGLPTREEKLGSWRERMAAVVSGERSSAYAAAINRPLLAQIDSGEITPQPAHAELVYDAPDKLLVSRHDTEQRILANELMRRFNEADKEILVITPYFVPQAEGMVWIRDILANGTRVTVITNSLASNNHTAAHSGYARYRRQLLQAGVRLHELKVVAAAQAEGRSVNPDSVTLHTKAAVIDGRQLFIGSLNFDPRSVALNTEVGLFIDSDEVAGAYLDEVNGALPRYTYQLRLSDKGQLRWHYQYGETEKVFTREPETGFWKRFMAGFYRLLPIESQL